MVRGGAGPARSGGDPDPAQDPGLPPRFSGAARGADRRVRRGQAALGEPGPGRRIAASPALPGHVPQPHPHQLPGAPAVPGGRAGPPGAGRRPGGWAGAAPGIAGPVRRFRNAAQHLDRRPGEAARPAHAPPGGGDRPLAGERLRGRGKSRRLLRGVLQLPARRARPPGVRGSLRPDALLRTAGGPLAGGGDLRPPVGGGEHPRVERHPARSVPQHLPGRSTGRDPLDRRRDRGRPGRRAGAADAGADPPPAAARSGPRLLPDLSPVLRRRPAQAAGRLLHAAGAGVLRGALGSPAAGHAPGPAGRARGPRGDPAGSRRRHADLRGRSRALRRGGGAGGGGGRRRAGPAARSRAARLPRLRGDDGSLCRGPSEDEPDPGGDGPPPAAGRTVSPLSHQRPGGPRRPEAVEAAVRGGPHPGGAGGRPGEEGAPDHRDRGQSAVVRPLGQPQRTDRRADQGGVRGGRRPGRRRLLPGGGRAPGRAQSQVAAGRLREVPPLRPAEDRSGRRGDRRLRHQPQLPGQPHVPGAAPVAPGDLRRDLPPGPPRQPQEAGAVAGRRGGRQRRERL